MSGPRSWAGSASTARPVSVRRSCAAVDDPAHGLGDAGGHAPVCGDDAWLGVPDAACVPHVGADADEPVLSGVAVPACEPTRRRKLRGEDRSTLPCLRSQYMRLAAALRREQQRHDDPWFPPWSGSKEEVLDQRKGACRRIVSPFKSKPCCVRGQNRRTAPVGAHLMCCREWTPLSPLRTTDFASAAAWRELCHAALAQRASSRNSVQIGRWSEMTASSSGRWTKTSKRSGGRTRTKSISRSGANEANV